MSSKGIQQQQQQQQLYFLTNIKYTNITPPANSKANRGRWCVDGLGYFTVVEMNNKVPFDIYNRKGQSREKIEIRESRQLLDKRGLIFFKIGDYFV